MNRRNTVRRMLAITLLGSTSSLGSYMYANDFAPRGLSHYFSSKPTKVASQKPDPDVRQDGVFKLGTFFHGTRAAMESMSDSDARDVLANGANASITKPAAANPPYVLPSAPSKPSVSPRPTQSLTKPALTATNPPYVLPSAPSKPLVSPRPTQSLTKPAPYLPPTALGQLRTLADDSKQAVVETKLSLKADVEVAKRITVVPMLSHSASSSTETQDSSTSVDAKALSRGRATDLTIDTPRGTQAPRRITKPIANRIQLATRVKTPKPSSPPPSSSASRETAVSQTQTLSQTPTDAGGQESLNTLNQRIAKRLALAAATHTSRIRQVAQNQEEEVPPGSPFEIIDEAGSIEVQMRRSRLLKTKAGVFRTAIVDPSICDVVQYTPRELSIIGRRAGATHVTFWFEDENRDPMTYLVRVTPDLSARSDLQRRYDVLEGLLAELFPDSKVRLNVVADKLVVRGQAKDSAEATQILSIIRSHQGQFTNNRGFNSGQAATVQSADELGQGRGGPGLQVINLLHVPGVHQVALRVKIAELNRSAARGAGIDLDANIQINGNQGAILLNSMLNAAGGNAPALLGQIDNNDIEIGLRWLQEQGVVRLVSEPTLVTLSGYPATFVAGGEFAVPTVVGTGGLNAVTTDFRAFGAIISFLPTVIDKDRVRLQVSPEFSQINGDLSVGGTPGLQVRAVTTTVEMREGQTLAIAGLLDESLTSTSASNLPWLEKIVGKRDTSRNETELIILVTPELVHPMEPEEVPPLPGFDVTEPTDQEFYWHGRLEGHPTREHRSTVWPRLRRRYGSGGSSMISGPFGHGQ